MRAWLEMRLVNANRQGTDTIWSGPQETAEEPPIVRRRFPEAFLPESTGRGGVGRLAIID